MDKLPDDRQPEGNRMLQPGQPDITAGDRVPLCVDLDGTLIRTDILWEMAIGLWRRPGLALRALRALSMGGKAAFKAELAEETEIDAAALPYREEVLAFARAQRDTGRQIVLATATHRIVAQRIADHLGMFSQVYATEGGTNLSGDRKRGALESSFGKEGFDYVGDSDMDLPVFSAARESYLVAPSRSLFDKASATANVSRVFAEENSKLRSIVRAMRLHQWVKNLLLFVPLLAAHRLLDAQAWISAVSAFFGFGFVASATYLLNDLVDLRADRLHPQKRHRPLASGRLSIPAGLTSSLALALLGFGASYALLPSAFVLVLASYAVLTLAYSFDLKRRLLVDVLALAVLYTLRVVAGAAAIGVAVSEWLLMFSLFMFFSLAFLKRAIELREKQGGARLSGRGYFPADVEMVRVLGVCSGLISVLVLALYINSPAVSELYRAPQVLWLLCPLLIYWISRIWFLGFRGQVDHDPVVFTLSDWRSYIVGAMSAAVIIFATVGPIWIR
jgi:4-hydroxybenzoate polyprenyltransferase/phosphoserine phosphatase